MAGPQSFVDNLKNLQLVMSVALEHVQENRNQFVRDATGEQAQQSEMSIRRIRTLVEQLEKEFNALGYLISVRPPHSSSEKQS
jgi:hypothetical protein